MIPAEFEYAAPRSLAEAQKLLASTPGAKVLAGGMSLIPALKHRLAAAPLLVDIRRIAGLDGVVVEGGRIRIGARATHRALLAHPELGRFAVFGEAANGIGDAQVRNRGTFGGSLVHADPAGDWPAVFLALGGEAKVVGEQGERAVAADDFFVGMLTSAVGEGELLTEVVLTPETGRAGTAYEKLRQPASGFAIVGVAAQVALDGGGRIARAALGVTGVNAVPFRAKSVEQRLVGKSPSEAELKALCANADEADPMEDLHASAEYRRHLLGVFAARAVARSLARARA